MKRGLIVLVCVLLAGFAGFWLMRSQKAPRHHGTIIDSMPELAWVKTDLKLTDAQFGKVSDLHAAYRPKCADMCRSLAEAHEAIEALAEKDRRMTPELEAAIRRHAAVHAACQQAMLEHLYQTAALLDPGQATRYLEVMVPEALESAHGKSGTPETH